LVGHHRLVSSYQPLTVDLFKHDQDPSIHRHSGVRSLVYSGGVAEISGAGDDKRLDEVNVTAG
jgi:hypothetical protein